MSRRRRNAYSSYYGSRGGSRGLADWFGLLALLCMLVCSVILLVRVLGAGVLTTALTVVLILVLVLLNGLHAFVQLPVRRNVAGKLICAVVALVLSAAMIFTSTAAGSLMKFLSNITSGGSAKTTTCVVVRADDPAETVNDTFGYTYGILETLDRENTDAALSHIEDGMGQVKTASFGTLTQLADALLNRQVDAVLTLRLADRDSEDIPLQPVTQCRCGLVYSKQYFHNVHTIYDLRDADFLVYGNDIQKRLESMIRTACGNRFVPHLRDCGTPSAAAFELSRGTGIMFFTDWDSIVRSEQFGYLLLDGTVAIDALYRDEPGGAELARQLAAAFSDAAPE